MIRRAIALAACLVAPMVAQGIYQNANSPGDSICPRVDRDKTSLNFGAPSRTGSTTGGSVGADSTIGRSYQQGQQFLSQDQRPFVGAFTAFEEAGKGTSIASLRGKVVLVGLWSVRCDPSAKMLMEFASIYPKRDQFGFEILSVNFDESKLLEGTRHGMDIQVDGGWRAISKFRAKNRQFLEATKLPFYTPGLGKEGASNFMDIVHSLPVLFVIDREGNLAQVHVGYKDGFVGEALKRALLEKPIPPMAPSTDPAKPSHP